MNLCFLAGKIVSDINFKFIINSKNISIACFNLQLNNGSIIKVSGYNEIADYCYSNLRKNDFINIQGYLSKSSEVIVETIEKI